MRRSVFILLWLFGGAAFAPLLLFGAGRGGQAWKEGLWKRNDLLRSSEIWSPQTGRWTRSGDLPEAFAGHEAVLLRSGDVLAVDRQQRGLVAARWSSAGGLWSAAGGAAFHSRPRLIALPDGGALAAGLAAVAVPGGNAALFRPPQNAGRSLPRPGRGG